ncbi:hypothetical protein [Desulfatitalea alkaliphila]|uniref:Uncharacterized protein n=1 Tax=Desulfatitalea alkaliphila TaxID=2929485 RepID=A0AA41R6Q0_9BACT|nr:hypothetical protein [Desulfatitalea alkaliphila]MCJ8502220.1 hypothetical protein [Desulfatitalea alkaliphila]
MEPHLGSAIDNSKVSLLFSDNIFFHATLASWIVFAAGGSSRTSMPAAHFQPPQPVRRLPDGAPDAAYRITGKGKTTGTSVGHAP